MRAVELAHVVDVRLVRPGGDRRALDELLRRRPDRRPEAAQRVDDLGAARRRSPSGSPVIDERFESVLKTTTFVAVGDLQRRDRRLVEPELRVRLVGAEQEAVLARARGELLVERERRDRAGRVVRVADPEERDLVPRVERVEVGQPAVAPRAAARVTTPPPAKSAPRS